MSREERHRVWRGMESGCREEAEWPAGTQAGPLLVLVPTPPPPPPACLVLASLWDREGVVIV